MRDELFPLAANLSLPIPLKMYVLNTFLLNPQSRQHLLTMKTRRQMRLFACNVCGLNDEVRDYLSDINDLTDTPPEFYIGKYITTQSSTIEDDWTLKHKLVHLGFNEITAEFLADILKIQGSPEILDDPTVWTFQYVHRMCGVINYQVNDC